MRATMTTGATPYDVIVQAGETAHTLRLSMAAIMAAEKESGLSISELGEQMRRPRVTAIVTMLWAMLRTHHAEITIDQAADLIDAWGITVAIQAFDEAFSRSSFREIAENPPRPAAASRRRGKR